MVTHTTPSRAKRSPAYWATAPEPFTNAPPCIHTMTGRPARPGSGVQTFRFRQSSPAITGSGRSSSYGFGYPGLGTVGPYAMTSRTPSHASGHTGGLIRFGPNGGAA